MIYTMTLNKEFIIIAILTTTFFSCNSNKTESGENNITHDTIESQSAQADYDRTENLKLSIADTIKKSVSFFFSSTQSKDLFLLTIDPGLIKNSKAKLQIITAENKVIYTQTFNAFYFVRYIYEPDMIPATGGQEYLEKYWKSITPKQYEAFFKKSVNNFFDVISPIVKDKYEYIKGWEEDISDKDFYSEILADSTSQLIDIICFDCEEGGTIMGYSRKQNKVITLVEHD
jgi:hypothetical protein